MIQMIEVGLAVMAIVLVSMLLLVLILEGARRLAGRAQSDPSPAAAPAAPDPVLIAILTAAASEALRAPVLIQRVHVRHAEEGDRWSRAGRMDIMISHRVGPRR
jgi:hypothetical protein